MEIGGDHVEFGRYARREDDVACSSFCESIRYCFTQASPCDEDGARVWEVDFDRVPAGRRFMVPTFRDIIPSVGRYGVGAKISLNHGGGVCGCVRFGGKGMVIDILFVLIALCLAVIVGFSGSP